MKLEPVILQTHDGLPATKHSQDGAGFHGRSRQNVRMSNALRRCLYYFADGSKGSPLFVIEGTRVKYSEAKSERTSYIQTIIHCFPYSVEFTKKEEVTSLDTKNFIEYCKRFRVRSEN